MSASQQGLSVRAAPVVHLALVASSLIVLGVCWVVRGGVPMALLPESRTPIGYLGYAIALGLLVAGLAARSRIGEIARGDDIAAWWERNRAKILLLWGLGDAGCVAGSVFWLLTDNQLVLLALGGVGLFLLAAHPPSKLFSYR